MSKKPQTKWDFWNWLGGSGWGGGAAG